jgi:hypothetical protein
MLCPLDADGHERRGHRLLDPVAASVRPSGRMRGSRVPAHVSGWQAAAADGVVPSAFAPVPPDAGDVAGAVPGQPRGAAVAGAGPVPGGGLRQAGRERTRLLRHALCAVAQRGHRRPADRPAALGADPVGGLRRRAGRPARACAAGGRRSAVRRWAAHPRRSQAHRRELAGGLRHAPPGPGRLDRAVPGRAGSRQALPGAAAGAGPRCRPGPGRSRRRAGQRHLGPGGVRPSRPTVVRRDRPGVAAAGRQAVGGRATAPPPRRRRLQCPAEDQRARVAVRHPAAPPRPGRRAGRVGSNRHRELPQPAGLLGVDREDQPVPPQRHLPRRALPWSGSALWA